MENWDADDRRPMIAIAKTTKGYWPAASNGKLTNTVKQIVSYQSHPYGQKMNSDYFVALAGTFEARYGVTFEGIRNGAVSDERERLIQFKTNMDVVMSVLDKNGLGRLGGRPAGRRSATRSRTIEKSPLPASPIPSWMSGCKVANLPMEPQKAESHQSVLGRGKRSFDRRCSRKPAKRRGARRAISEIIKWMNYVTENRFFTLAADLSESINVEHGSLWGHYDPENNPAGTRVKAAIQEAGNVCSAIGLVSQIASVDPKKFAGVWALSGTYGAFTPLMYTPARIWSQQNQDSKFRTGVLHILVGHSGPETAADGRSHFGIFATQVWKLFPRGQTIQLNFWDYNDVAAGYFAAAEIAAREQKVGIIIIEVARPDFPVADRSKFADKDVKAAAKGLYVIRDFAPGKPKPRLCHRQRLKLDGQSGQGAAQAGRSGDQCESDLGDQRGAVRPPAGSLSQFGVAARSLAGRHGGDLGHAARLAGARAGPLTDAYSLTSDWDNQWLTGGLEKEVIAEAHLDPEFDLQGRRALRQGADQTKFLWFLTSLGCVLLIHPSTLELMFELGILQDFLKRPHDRELPANRH